MLRGPATINIWSDDLDSAKKWYADLLGVEAYFERPGYAEFRIGDFQTELGIIDRRFAPKDAPTAPGGLVLHWAVDDVKATLARLIELGAEPYMPLTERGPGFVTAAVVDPFGNVLAVMENRHYLEVLEGTTA
ncbi:VOC family protein [Actinomadura harenae]|uniref:VOC family protein n=1 Tax=Actinomadura harenae TaxID=2483351 RepID=A0A3M2M1P7_9ACTN|nr:VOC family protein [Actinomadura harenae]RMI40988.1 VOC family protein [Actinomadura harenae]